MLVEILLGFLTLLFVAYLYLRFWKWAYFDKKGIFQIKPSFPFGNFNDLFIWGKHTNDMVQNMYKQAYGHKVYGLYILGIPVYSIADPDLVRRILVKDFDHFVDRQENRFQSVSRSKTDEAWGRQLTSLNGDEWKEVRSTFSPIFTSGKMKAMMVFIRETSRRLSEEFAKNVEANTEFELKDVFGKFSMDTIASCAFGVDAQSFSSTESQFVKNASSVFTRGPLEMLKFVIIMIPGLNKLFKLSGASIFKPKETKFFMDVVQATLRSRLNKDAGNVPRNDLIDLMIKAMKEDDSIGNTTANEDDDGKDQFDIDAELQNRQKLKKKELDELTIVATAMLMLIAGYDTTAQTLAYAGYQLARNPEVQKCLQDEVDGAYEDANGEEPDYTVIQNLPYLEMVVHETLRLHPPAGVLGRVCVKDFKSEGLDIKKGTSIHIPVVGIHMDPRHYPNPEVFNPENFSKENKAKRSPYTFLGFGQGPRACLAMRFALLEAKVALMSVVRKYELLTCAKTVDKIELDPKSALGGNKGGLWVKARARQV